MGYMSYCRFENTASDMRDCLDDINDNIWRVKDWIAEMSDSERRGLAEFVDMCKEVANDFENIEIDI